MRIIKADLPNDQFGQWMNELLKELLFGIEKNADHIGPQTLWMDELSIVNDREIFLEKRETFNDERKENVSSSSQFLLLYCGAQMNG